MALTKKQRLAVGATAALALLLLLSRRRPGPVIDTPAIPRDQAKRIIKAEALRQGVDPGVALLFADLESRFNSNAVGDKDWPFRRDSKGRTRWERFVRDNPRYIRNPFRDRKELWVSYGLFQLLSPFELWREDPNEDPRILADPRINARLAVAKIKRLTNRFGDDVLKVRLAYGGCVVTGRACPPGTVLRIARKLAERAPLYGVNVGTVDEAIARAQALASDVPT